MRQDGCLTTASCRTTGAMFALCWRAVCVIHAHIGAQYSTFDGPYCELGCADAAPIAHHADAQCAP
jgi:hypothetical protein